MFVETQQHVRRKPLALSAVPLVLGLMACAGDGIEYAPMAGEPTLVASPAGEGSGEPHLSHGEDGPLLSWLEPTGDGDEYRLAYSQYQAGSWTPARTIVKSDGFFVNWADFPSLEEIDGSLVSHWLQRGDAGGYDYGVRVARSADDGESWSAPWTPHEDGTPTEHGFVSMFPVAEGTGMVWLDGRTFVGADGGEGAREMQLRYRTLDAAGMPGPEVVVDNRICDCCQTDAVITSGGPLVVYRNRTEDEIRDIYVTRQVNGAWTEGQPIHDDGWNIASCPVNGPAAAVQEDRVAVAWFTGAEEQAKVKVALSSDAGATFGPPQQVDDGNPSGRVDVLMLDDGSALVSWIERTGSGAADVRMRRVRDDGVSPSSTLARSSESRASGFPMMLALSDSEVLLAWTEAGDDDSQVRTATLEIQR